jgi:cell division protein ZapA
MNILNVKINGIDYNLKGEENEEYLIKISSYVDKKVRAMLESNDKLSTSSAAVLCALNSADEMFKLETKCKELTMRIDQLEKTEKKSQIELGVSQKQFTNLEDSNALLKQKVENMKNGQYIKKKDEEIGVNAKEAELMKENVQKGLDENAKLKFENKNYKFEIQSVNAKLMEIEQKFISSQVSLAKERKIQSPLKVQK